MPKIKNKEKRFKILNECLRDPHRYYTYETLLDELKRQLTNQDDSPVSERTLKDDIDDMKKEKGIKLDEKLAKQRPVVLRYADLTDSIYKLSPDEANALQKTIDLLLQYPEIHPIQYDYIRICLQQIVKNECLDVDSPTVSFADNLEHKGREHFESICRYILDKCTISIEYQPYDAEVMNLIVWPYLLKQYNERWFLIAGEPGIDGLRVFPLDRIVSVKESVKAYRECKIDLEDYFDEFVGVTRFDDAKVENVLLKVKSKRYHYLETKPIISRQTLIHSLSTDDEKVIKVPVRINNELITMIMSFGDDVEVLEPQWLRDKIAEKVCNMYSKYKPKEE